MEYEILVFQFEPVSARPTHPSHNDGSDQDEPQKQPPEVFCKKRCFQKFRKTHCKTPVPESLFKNNFIKKETLAQVFSNELCEISKNTFFTEHIWATASGTKNPA